jgi:hypothetical protein
MKLHAIEVGLMFPASQTIGNHHIFAVSVFVLRLNTHLSIQSKLVIVLTSIKSIAGTSFLSPSNLICEFRLFQATWQTDRNFVTTFEIALMLALCAQGTDGAGRIIGCPTLGVAQGTMREAAPHARGVSKARRL